MLAFAARRIERNLFDKKILRALFQAATDRWLARRARTWPWIESHARFTKRDPIGGQRESARWVENRRRVARRACIRPAGLARIPLPCV
jgi:hypothetical protein